MASKPATCFLILFATLFNIACASNDGKNSNFVFDLLSRPIRALSGFSRKTQPNPYIYQPSPLCSLAVHCRYHEKDEERLASARNLIMSASNPHVYCRFSTPGHAFTVLHVLIMNRCPLLLESLLTLARLRPGQVNVNAQWKTPQASGTALHLTIRMNPPNTLHHVFREKYILEILLKDQQLRINERSSSGSSGLQEWCTYLAGSSSSIVRSQASFILHVFWINFLKLDFDTQDLLLNRCNNAFDVTAESLSSWYDSTELHSIVSKFNFKRLSTLSLHSISFDAQIFRGKTAFCHLVAHCREGENDEQALKTAEALMEAGANINRRCHRQKLYDFDFLPIHTLTSRRCSSWLKRLLSLQHVKFPMKANKPWTDSVQRGTALHLAIAAEHAKVDLDDQFATLRALLSTSRVDVNARSNFESSAVQEWCFAQESGHFSNATRDYVLDLFASRLDLDDEQLGVVRDRCGSSHRKASGSLYHAFQLKDAVGALRWRDIRALSPKISLDAKILNGQSSLCFLATNFDCQALQVLEEAVQTFEELLRSGADPNLSCELPGSESHTQLLHLLAADRCSLLLERLLRLDDVDHPIRINDKFVSSAMEGTALHLVMQMHTKDTVDIDGCRWLLYCFSASR